MQNKPYLVVLSLLLMVGQVGFGQSAEKGNRIVSLSGCANINFEQEGYVVRSSRIDDPFDFLPWVRTRERRAAAQIASLVNGQPFRYATAVGKALEIIDNENFLPDTSETRVKIRLEFVTTENCSNRSLDLAYRVYSTQVRPVLSSTPEARVLERQAPQEAAGLSNVDVPSSRAFDFTPMAGYDATNKLAAGARLKTIAKQPWRLPFDAAIVQGQASTEMRTISAAISGSADSVGWLAHSEWSLNFANFSLPTGAGHLKGGTFSAQVSGTTQPFAQGNLTMRFGALLEGGNRQSTIRNARLSPDTILNEAFGALKLYAGLDSRLPHNVFSFSYGLELGSIGPSARVDWRKHVGDLRHELWYSLGDHRTLDLESRLTIGLIQVPGKIPLAERFFGGNNEESFIPGDFWQIRENPVIRAIPGSGFYRTANGDGGKRFFSYNLTAAYALWRKPLIPTELTADPEFHSLIEAQITNATSIEQLHYATKDPHYIALAGQLKNVQDMLADLKAAVTAAQTARPGQLIAEFKGCLAGINRAASRARSAIESKDAQQYGFIAALLSADEDENRLAKVNRACLTDLNAALGDAAIAGTGAGLEIIRNTMEGEFRQIDLGKAEAKAKADMAFTRRTLKTLFNDVNLYSISPVLVFDVARIAAKKSSLDGGVRYGPGVGLRVELASTMHFTAGYAWNVRQGPGERRGTMFFSLAARDLFR